MSWIVAFSTGLLAVLTMLTLLWLLLFGVNRDTTITIIDTPLPQKPCVLFVSPDTFQCADHHVWKHQGDVWIDLGTTNHVEQVPLR